MQRLTLMTPIGGTCHVELTGDDPKQLIQQAAFWQSLPTECGVCSAPLVFAYSDARGFVYYSLKCTGKPAHILNLSERKDESKRLYCDSRRKFSESLFQHDHDDDHRHDQQQAFTGLPDHPNAPDGKRGQMIASIERMRQELFEQGITPRVNIENLGAKSDLQLQAIADHLAQYPRGEAQTNGR